MEGPIAKAAHPESFDADFHSRVSRDLTLPLAAAAVLLDGTLLFLVWGDWARVGALLASLIGGTVFNLVAIPPLNRRRGLAIGEGVRWAFNVGNLIFQGHLLHWPLPVWAFLPFLCYGVDGVNDPTAVWRLLLGAAVFDSAGLLDGGSILAAAAFSALALGAALTSLGRARIIRGMVLELREGHKQLEGAHGALQELHERAIAQQKLAGLGLLAAGVAHEINNPMSFVTANLESLVDSIRELPTSPELLEEIATQILPSTLAGVQRVNAIVADLRRFARSDLETPAPVDVNSEVEAALRIARAQLRQRCTLDVKLGEIAPVRGCPRQLSQVFVNLLVNASQAIPLERTGLVGVSTTVERGHVVVRVTDNGAGMSEETQRRLFEPFFTTKPVGEGTGLGLSIVHGIVKSHGGRVEVRSQVGRGTTFSVVLPVSAA